MDDGKSRERQIAELVLTSAVVNANKAITFGEGSFGEIDLTEAVSIMRELASKVKDGDLTSLEDT